MDELEKNKLKTILESSKNKPTVVINEIQFTFLYKSQDVGSDRDLCQIIAKKNNDIELLTFYTSISNGGFWRFAVTEGNTFKKGTDYVVTTFVHFKLQEFINNNFQHSEYLQISTRTTGYNINIFEKFIDVPERIANDPIFNVLTKCLSAHCFTKPSYFDESIFEYV